MDSETPRSVASRPNALRRFDALRSLRARRGCRFDYDRRGLASVVLAARSRRIAGPMKVLMWSSGGFRAWGNLMFAFKRRSFFAWLLRQRAWWSGCSGWLDDISLARSGLSR